VGDVPESLVASLSVDQGTLPKADQATQEVFIKALNAIDPEIVGDKDPSTMVTRGRSQCTSVKGSPDDKAKLVELTGKRFTAPNHPDGFGTEKNTKILAAVRKYLCPTY
jgi:hypothetical protein